MTISDYVFEQNIKEYANLLKKQYELREKLSNINDELGNLSCFMTKEDIEEAYKLFEEMMGVEEYDQ